MKDIQKFIFNIKKFQSISQIVVEIDQWIMPFSDTSNNNWMSHCRTTEISDETKGARDVTIKNTISSISVKFISIKYKISVSGKKEIIL